MNGSPISTIFALKGIGSGSSVAVVGETHLLRDVLHAYLAGLEGPLEGVPGVRLGEKLAGFQHQEAAVGLMQRAGLDHAEIGEEGAELGLVLDAAHQILQDRVALVDNGGPGLCGVVHQHVDSVLAEGPLALLPPRDRYPHEHDRGLFIRLLEVFGVVDNVGQHGLEVVHHLRHGAPAVTHVVDKVLGCEGGHFTVEFSHGVAAGAFVLPNEPHDLLQMLVERLQALVDALLLFGGECLVCFARHGLALSGLGRESQTRRGAHHDETAGIRLLAEVGELRLLLLADLLSDDALLLLVLLAFEGMGDGRLQVLDELLHVLAELLGLACRQVDGVRTVRLSEVVDVHPVVGRGARGGLVGQEVVDGARLAGPRGSRGVDVVAVVVDAHAEGHRRDRSVLTDDLGEVRKLVCGLEGERRWVTDSIDVGGSKFRRYSDHEVLRFGGYVPAAGTP